MDIRHTVSGYVGAVGAATAPIWAPALGTWFTSFLAHNPWAAPLVAVIGTTIAAVGPGAGQTPSK